MTLKGIREWVSGKGRAKKKSNLDGLQVPQAGAYLYRSGWELGSQSSMPINSGVYWTGSNSITNVSLDSTQAIQATKKMDERIEKKPVEVFKEIIAETPVMNIVDLDGQIAMVEKRKDMFAELGVSPVDEYEALMFLKARKVGLEQEVHFGWSTTTFDMIEKLLKKYKLSYVDFGSYAKNIPMEAIDELEKFMAEYKKVRDDKPVLKLIIDESPVRDEAGKVKETVSRERKKDPILLASSPFGRWFYILGAWDKEVQIVDDLVYHGK